MIKSKLATWDKKRLRFVLILFFLALAIPTAILILKAYSQLKWEAFHHYRSQAEELSTRINLRYRELIEIESARAFTDYSFLNVAKNNSEQFLQRSPLSAYPVNSKFPGIVGYFQIDNHGQFTTPLLPPVTAIQLSQNKNYGLSAIEKTERKNLQNIIYQILNKNKLVNKSTIQVAKQKNIPKTEEVNKAIAGERNSFELKDQVIASPAKPSPENLSSQSAVRVTSSDKIENEPLITAQTAFDNLKTQKKHVPRERKSKASSKGRPRVEDLKLEKQYQKESQKQLLALSKKQKRKKIVRRRIESNVLPSYPALLQEKKNQTGKKDAELRVNMFESEIDAFEFSLLESGQFVLYRKVWRNGLRYIQGLLINRNIFIDSVIGHSFYKTNVSNASKLTIAYQGDILSTFKSKSSPRFYASDYSSSDFDSTDFNIQGNQQLQGTLLLQNKLSAALGQIELIFSVNNLPAGPGASVVTWLSVILLLILCGGFFILYLLGLKQIKLARQQQDFVSAISHELKTPLTSIRMYGEMLREGWTTEDKRQQYYDYIFDESERLTRLINNVLQLARMTRNELPVDLKEYTVAELIDTVRSKISSQLERAEFKLSLACDDSVKNMEMLADSDYFIQIIINLVDNAIKFSSKSEKQQVDISCHVLRNNNIQFTIRDYGPGINKDQMRKIFDLFYRTENELTRETVGTGIGLSLVQQLVSSMHGKIDIINKEPGAEFQITFKSI
ncbi:MAG: HAMP domain-containing histidine kinase [Gammaproteobacteria bacterium]|nr:HAMP domain-containing histidine kinase [Gammaproteobacteria bacterium]